MDTFLSIKCAIFKTPYNRRNYRGVGHCVRSLQIISTTKGFKQIYCFDFMRWKKMSTLPIMLRSTSFLSTSSWEIVERCPNVSIIHSYQDNPCQFVYILWIKVQYIHISVLFGVYWCAPTSFRLAFHHVHQQIFPDLTVPTVSLFTSFPLYLLLTLLTYTAQTNKIHVLYMKLHNYVRSIEVLYWIGEFVLVSCLGR